MCKKNKINVEIDSPDAIAMLKKDLAEIRAELAKDPMFEFLRANPTEIEIEGK